MFDLEADSATLGVWLITADYCLLLTDYWLLTTDSDGPGLFRSLQCLHKGLDIGEFLGIEDVAHGRHWGEAQRFVAWGQHLARFEEAFANVQS